MISADHRPSHCLGGTGLLVAEPGRSIAPQTIRAPQTHSEQSGQDTQTQPQGATDARYVVKVLPTLKTAEEVAQEAEDREEKRSADRWLVRWTAVLSLATMGLMLLTGILGYFAFKQSRDMKASIAEARRSADAAKDAANAAVLNAQAIIKAERAYVKMSHAAPGVMFSEDNRIDTTVDVRNFGRTPANVTDVILNAHFSAPGEPLPDVPTYQPLIGPGIPSAFLVSDDNFFFQSSPISEADMMRLREQTRQLHLLGYVDYIDQFGQRHRGGYARLYRPAVGNNLIFVAQRGYNYDRPRQPGEGNDWGQ